MYDLSRIVVQSHFRASTEKKRTTNLLAAKRGESSYLPASFAIGWIETYLKYAFKKKHPFVEYAPGEIGVYALPVQAKIALAGDWGTGTNEAALVGQRMQEFGPDYAIHLGDVYFVGDADEVKQNFLGVPGNSSFDPVKWPTAHIRSFSLSGNHDMYSSGDGYFDVLLPGLDQKASFFCIENEFWKIIGLDTGYNSTGMFAKHNLPDALMKWLLTTAFSTFAGSNQGIILLSHHQPWSSFERAIYPRAAQQLACFIKKPVLWFWGHEHRMVAYELFYPKSGIAAYGRCIGHGGMPVERKGPINKDVPWLIYDNRRYPNAAGLDVGYNGHAELEFSGQNLNVNYRDLTGGLAYREAWGVDAGGNLVRHDLSMGDNYPQVLHS